MGILLSVAASGDIKGELGCDAAASRMLAPELLSNIVDSKEGGLHG